MIKFITQLALILQINSYFNYNRLSGLKTSNQNKIIQEGPKYAVCVLMEDNNSGVSGVIAMKQDSVYSRIQIIVKINGLFPNTIHGFHIHKYGNTQNGCTSQGGHYNPNNYDHAGPNDLKRHVGDLGNIESDNQGKVYTFFQDSEVSLFGQHSVIGRGCVLHEKIDDLGRGGNEESKKTGNAGKRIGCGVIAISNSIDEFQYIQSQQ